jgi:hypothetical protein
MITGSRSSATSCPQTRSGHHLLALTLVLKCFQRLGYFPGPIAIATRRRTTGGIDDCR